MPDYRGIPCIEFGTGKIVMGRRTEKMMDDDRIIQFFLFADLKVFVDLWRGVSLRIRRLVGIFLFIIATLRRDILRIRIIQVDIVAHTRVHTKIRTPVKKDDQ
jgi:hypothetical protein